jgi:hypothetical protein
VFLVCGVTWAPTASSTLAGSKFCRCRRPSPYDVEGGVRGEKRTATRAVFPLAYPLLLAPALFEVNWVMRVLAPGAMEGSVRHVRKVGVVRFRVKSAGRRDVISHLHSCPSRRPKILLRGLSTSPTTTSLLLPLSLLVVLAKLAPPPSCPVLWCRRLCPGRSYGY